MGRSRRIWIAGLALGVAVVALGVWIGVRSLAAARPLADPQRLAYERLTAESAVAPALTFHNGFPRGVLADVRVEGEGAAERARAFLARFRDLYLQADPALELHLRRVSESGEDVLFFQTYAGIPVYGGEIVVSLQGDRFQASVGGLLPGGVQLDTTPGLAPQDGEALAREAIGQPQAPIFGRTELVVFDRSLLEPVDSNPRLAWRVAVGDRDPYVVLIDAWSGEVLLRYSQTATHSGGYDLDLEDANGANAADTACYWDTTDDDQIGDEEELYEEAQNDSDAVNAWNYSWAVYSFYHSWFGRHSYDNDNGQLEIYVHASNQGSAAWTGGSVDCDLIEFNNGVVGYDVMVHEFTHGVIDFTSDLIGSGQSGSLNESYADIMASLADGNWTMGEGTALGIIRSLSNPPAYMQGGFAQPDHISEFVSTSADDGGEHINNGIPNFVAYLLAEGGTHPDSGVTIQAIGPGAMGQIYYRTMVALSSSAWLIDARNLTVAKAQSLYGTQIACIVRNAFYAVGLGNPDGDCNGVEENPDADGDGVPFGQDNCPWVFNPSQTDLDGDGKGSGCDYDDNNNGMLDFIETSIANPYNLCPTPGTACDLENYDGDQHSNTLDNCPWVANDDQADTDQDGEGDACDPDADQDGWSNDNDNCPWDPNPDQADADGDMAGDDCDPTPDCPDVIGWSAGTVISTVNGDIVIEPKPIVDPFACIEATAQGTAVAPGSLAGLDPSGGGYSVRIPGGQGPYFHVPIPACLPAGEGPAEPGQRAQVVLTGLPEGIRTWISSEAGMSVSNRRIVGGQTFLRFLLEGGRAYQLSMAIFRPHDAAQGDLDEVTIELDCDPPAEAPEQDAENRPTRTPSLTPTPRVSSTPTPTRTPTLTPTPQACMLVALANLNCRLGPGRTYETIDGLAEGDAAQVIGSSLDGMFWYVIGPHSGRACTVPSDASLVRVEGACAVLPRFTPVPLPTATLTPTPTPRR